MKYTIDNLNKGDTVMITAKSKGGIIKVNGVVGLISENEIKIFHNFSGKNVIDFTIIKRESTIDILPTNPKQIENIDDLYFV